MYSILCYECTIFIQPVLILRKLGSQRFFSFTIASIHLAIALYISAHVLCTSLVLNIPDSSALHFFEPLQFFGPYLGEGHVRAKYTSPLCTLHQQAHTPAVVPWLFLLKVTIHCSLIMYRLCTQYGGTKMVRHSPLAGGWGRENWMKAVKRYKLPGIR